MPSEKEADLGAVFGFFFLVFGTVQLKSSEITSVCAQAWLNLWVSACQALCQRVLAGRSSFHKFYIDKEGCLSSKGQEASALFWVEVQLSLHGLHFRFLLGLCHFLLIHGRPCVAWGFPQGQAHPILRFPSADSISPSYHDQFFPVGWPHILSCLLLQWLHIMNEWNTHYVLLCLM